MNHRDFKKLVMFSKRFGVKRIKLDGLEVEFFTEYKSINIDPVISQPESTLPSDEEFLFWSSGYDPKEAREAAADDPRIGINEKDRLHQV